MSPRRHPYRPSTTGFALEALGAFKRIVDRHWEGWTDEERQHLSEALLLVAEHVYQLAAEVPASGGPGGADVAPPGVTPAP